MYFLKPQMFNLELEHLVLGTNTNKLYYVLFKTTNVQFGTGTLGFGY